MVFSSGACGARPSRRDRVGIHFFTIPSALWLRQAVCIPVLEWIVGSVGVAGASRALSTGRFRVAIDFLPCTAKWLSLAQISNKISLVLIRVGSATSATAVKCSEVFSFGARLFARCSWQSREGLGRREEVKRGNPKVHARKCLSREIPTQAIVDVWKFRMHQHGSVSPRKHGDHDKESKAVPYPEER